MLAAATQLCAALLAATFAWAGVIKVVRRHRWRDALRRYRLGRTLERAAFVAVPAAELLVVALFLSGAVKAAAALSVALVAGFSLAVVRARGFEGDSLPCGCFGGDERRDYRDMLVRNALLAAVAGIVLIAAPVGDGVASAPVAADAVPAALALGGIGLALWVASRAGRFLRRGA
jgi:hypothetical protein